MPFPAWLFIDARPETIRTGVFDANRTDVRPTFAKEPRFFVQGGSASFDDPVVKQDPLTSPARRIQTLRGLRTKLRDGVQLVSDVVKPVGEGPFPAILERTPYGRGDALAFGEFWARRGYAYIVQDCRGRGNSGGAWDPFVKEGKDGYDTIEWVARQKWCDGNVGMIGAGYGGVDQWQAAIERPPSLRCIVPEAAPSDAMRDWPYEFGTFDLSGALAWTHAFEDRVGRGAVTSLPNPQGLETLPLNRVDQALFGRANPIYQGWLKRTTLDDWSGFDHLDRLPESQVPALQIAGHPDGDGMGTKLNWETMRRVGRKDQWLVWGPWVHASRTTMRDGSRDLGPKTTYDVDDLVFRFFETYLKGRSVGMQNEPRVRAFVTGANRWIETDGWPGTNSSLETLYLSTNGLEKNPGDSGATVYTYDPAKDRGKESSLRTEFKRPSAGTYALFQSAPLDRNTAIAGPFEVRLFFKTSAKDTDLFASLLDVDSKGSFHLIGRPGKLRASYRESVRSPSLLRPGQTYAALVRPWDAAHELLKGHRLGLMIQSSLFPRFARNLGTGEPMATGQRSIVQRNVVFSGTVTPSRITFRRLW